MDHAYIDYLRDFDTIIANEFRKVVRTFEKRPAAELSQEITTRLQYLDIITQRVQHLIDTHNTIMTLYIDQLFKNSFLQLQLFQFSIIVFDLIETLSIIETHQSNKNSQLTSCEWINRQAIEQMADRIKMSLRQQTANGQLLGIHALTGHQTKICRQLYTMDRERVVLDWFLNNASRDFQELLKMYQASKGAQSPIELF